MFRHLLIPLDGSPMAEAVLPSVVRLVEHTEAAVTLLHLIERDVPADIHGVRHIADAREAEAYLRHVAEVHFSGGRVSWHVHTDSVRNVASSVSSHTEEFQPDLIVMCAHDHVGWRRWLSGSIGQQIVRCVMPPVLLFRYEGGLSPEFPFRRVLIPLDGDPRHETGIDAGGELARLGGASTELVQVVPTRATLAGPRGIARSYLPATTEALLDLAEEETRRYLAGQLKRLKSRGLAATASMVRGEPFEELSAHIERIAPDLLVLGTHGKIGSEAFWAGSITQRLLDTCNATFLLAPAHG